MYFSPDVYLTIGYLDNELLAKENPSAEKPVKKARGGVASRKAKTNSMAASVARSKGKTENKHPPSLVEEESPRPSTTTPSKAGDLSFGRSAPAGCCVRSQTSGASAQAPIPNTSRIITPTTRTTFRCP